MDNSKKIVPTDKQVEQLQLVARLAVRICLEGKSDFFGSADMCNLHELALAGLGHIDSHPQVPIEEIEKHVKEQLGNSYLPVNIDANESKPQFVGPFCVHCGSEHLGINCRKFLY